MTETMTPPVVTLVRVCDEGMPDDSSYDSGEIVREDGMHDGSISAGGASPPARNARRNENVWCLSDGHDFVPNVHPFDSSFGITFYFYVRPLRAELEYFQTFFDDVILDKIVEQTNLQHDYLMDRDTDSSETKQKT